MKKLAAVLIGLLVVLVAAAFLLPRFVDANAYRAEIASSIAATIGRPVSIGGPIEFVLLPSPRLRASEVRSAGAAAGGFGVEAKRVELELGWRSLLGGPVEITHLRMAEPTITLEARSDQRPVWPWLDLGEGGAVRVERIDIENGRLVWSDARAGAREAVDQIQARVVASAAGGGLRATGSAVTHAVPLEFDALVGDAPAGRPRPVSLTLGLRPNLARVTLRGTIEPGGEHALRGHLQIEGDDLFTASDALGLAPPPTGIFAGALSQAFSIAGELTWSDAALAVNALALQVGDLRATGAANWTVAQVPVLDVTLDMTWVDIDRLLRLQRPRAARASPAPGGRPGGDGAVVAPVSGAAPARAAGVPKNFDASLNLNVEALALNGGVVRQVRVNAALNRGDLVINQVSALLPGGTELSGLAQVVPGTEPARVDGTLALRSDNLRGLLAWLGVDARNVPADRLRRFEGRTRIGGVLTRLELTGMDVRFDSSRVTGGMTLALAARPALGIDLRLDQINVDAYLRSDAAQPIPSQAGGAALVLSPALLDQFDANLKLRADTITLDGTPINGVALDGTLQNGALDLRELTLADVAGAALKASGRITGVPQQPAATLEIALRAVDATRLFRLADLAPPGNPSLGMSGRLAIQSDGSATLDDIALQLGETELRGRGGVSAGARPRLRLDLTGDTVPMAALPGPGPGGAGPDLDFDVTIGGAHFVHGRQTIDDARLEARGEGGTLSAAALTGSLYGGTLDIAARADGQDQATLKGTLALKQIALAEALRALTGTAAMTGRADLRLEFSTAAKSPGALSMLSGTAELNAGEGTIEGLDLAAMNQVATRTDPPADIVALLGAGLKTGSTPYRFLDATLRIENGVLRSDNLRIVTDIGEAKGGGTLDLEHGTIDFGLGLPIAADAGAPPLRVTASGTIDQPRIAVDFAQLQDYLLRRRADNPAPQPAAPGQ